MDSDELTGSAATPGVVGLLDRGTSGEVTLGGHVDLTMDLANRHHRLLDGARLHGLDFRY